VGDRLGIPWGADGFFGSVLGWAAAWEDLRVLSAFSFLALRLGATWEGPS
jgi:hypothetical protein